MGKGHRPVGVEPGTVFDRLTVLRLIVRDKDGHQYTLCECECVCGTIVEVMPYSLRPPRGRAHGNTRSCGCLQTERRRVWDIRPGMVFDRLTVQRLVLIETPTQRRTVCECECVCGALSYPTPHDLRHHNSRSCGCKREDSSRERITAANARARRNARNRRYL